MQIQRQEGNVVHHVDPAHGRLELDTVEGRQFSLPQDDVGQVKIAMAFAHGSIALPQQPGGAQRARLLLEPRLQRIDRAGLAFGSQLSEDRIHLSLHLLGRAELG